MPHSEPILYPSILIPRRRAGIVSRSRPLALLEQYLDHQLLLLIAPPGYGKTCLLVDFAHRTQSPVCWYTVDAYDQEPVRFLAHFIAAIARQYPGFGQAGQAVLHSLNNRAESADALIHILVNELHGHAKQRFILILDDFHHVDRQPFINAFLSRFLERTGEACCLVIASRRRPRLNALDRLTAYDQAAGLTETDLAFRGDEIQVLARQNYHIEVSAKDANDLAERTEGWITGLLLSNPAGWEARAAQLRAISGHVPHLERYWARLLSEQPAEVVNFLMYASLLDDFSAGLCAEAFAPLYPQGADWQGLIEAILHYNLFVQAIDQNGGWLRLHSLLREYLQARLKAEAPEQYAALLRRLAEVYTAQEEWEKARDAYLRLKDMDGLAGLLEVCGAALARSGRFALLRQWLDELPPALPAARPYLLAHKGITLAMADALPEAVVVYSQAIQALSAAGGNPQHLARALARRSNAYHMQGKYSLSLQDAETLVALTGHDADLRSEYAEGLSLIGLGLRQTGDAAGAVGRLNQALAIYQELGDEYSASNTLHTLGLSHRFLGDFAAAKNAYRQALEYAHRTQHLVRCADLLNNLAVLHNLLGEYEQAARLIQEGMQAARQSGYLRAEAFLFCTLGALHIELDDLPSALQAFAQARRIAVQIENIQLLGYLDREEAEIAWQSGNFAAARRLIESANAHAEKSGSQFEQTQCRRMWGRLAQEEGNLEQARNDLQEALDRFAAGGWIVEAAQVGLRLAAICWALGDLGKAQQKLAEAFRRIRPEASGALVDAGRHERTFLQQAGEQARLLLQRVEQFERDLPALRRRLRQIDLPVPPSPPALVIQAFGGKVSLHGRMITQADWQTGIVREMLFYLLFSPEGARRLALGAVFWPEATPKRLAGQLAITLHRLRRVLGETAVLYQDGRYAFNHALDYEYDVAQFNHLLESARSVLDVEKRVYHLKRAVLLYKDLYLPDVARDWANIERERLHQAHLEAIQFLAEYHLQRKEYPASLEYCWRILTQEPWQENVCRIAMRIMAAMGDRGAVIHLYQQCSQACQQIYRQSVSSETEALYQTLIR